MKLLAPLAFALLVGSSGCIIVDDNDGADYYESCYTHSDCAHSDAFCQDVSASWGSITASNAICTVGCYDDYDCPYSHGNDGVCLSLDSGYTFQCYETCASSYDCDPGFDCGLVDSGDYICLPR